VQQKELQKDVPISVLSILRCEDGFERGGRMKCTNCDGTGKEKLYDKLTHAYLLIKCAYCNGTGKIQQTNEEWLKQCNTEQLAEEIYECVMTHPWHISKEVILEWLKQPRKPIS
jgi:DnaJ-class molecular chaperone